MKKLKNKKITLLLTAIFLFGCAQVTSLNLKKHQFGKIPTKIVWLQVAGLSPEHMAMLKFSYPTRDQLTSFEKFLCVGSAWEYDLYKIRPDAKSSFTGQITGSKNIKRSCDDYNKKTIWQYLAPKGYKIGVFEDTSNKKESLLASEDCTEGKKYLDDLTLWSRKPVKKSKQYFHSARRGNYNVGSVYYDQSCQSGQCYSTLQKSTENAFENFQKNQNNYLFLFRNFNYMKYIKAGNITKAKEELEQLNNVIHYFHKKSEKNKDMLVLLTSGESYELNFPKSGREWKKYEKKNNLLRVKNSKLISPVFASGARAENFCGIYDQSQILGRIFSDAKQQGLEFSIINPFNN